jgi:hypothetical protein
MRKLFARVRPIEALMVGWTVLAFFAVAFLDGPVTMAVMVVLLLACPILGMYLEQRGVGCRQSGAIGSRSGALGCGGNCSLPPCAIDSTGD